MINRARLCLESRIFSLTDTKYGKRVGNEEKSIFQTQSALKSHRKSYKTKENDEKSPLQNEKPIRLDYINKGCLNETASAKHVIFSTPLKLSSLS